MTVMTTGAARAPRALLLVSFGLALLAARGYGRLLGRKAAYRELHQIRGDPPLTKPQGGRITAVGHAVPETLTDGGRHAGLARGLRHALAADNVALVYQPKIALDTCRVTGMEALARWSDPDIGPIPPADFVPVAEAAGLVDALTTSVLRQALADCRTWHDAGHHVGVAVNVSARGLAAPALVDQVAAMLATNRIAPPWLTLEITETSVVDPTGRAARTLEALRALGVRVSIDDFGTGYSSLTYLRGLPVQEVKIDKSFVDDLVEDRADRAVVGAIVTLATALRLTTVAEGVEQPAQAAVLASLGLDEVQGFFYGGPMTPDATRSWLRTSDRTRDWARRS
jgi:EAL domain-containing protein (putative c-di-GMP-specific phosphodiesterase class I)